jgi:hypothetical protein
MSQRLHAKSRILFRFILAHRFLFFTVVAVFVLGGVGIANSSAVRNTFAGLARNSDRAAPPKSTTGAITVHAAGRGKPYLNFLNGHSMQVEYRGNGELATALQNGAAQARSLASADFDRNGTPDVIAGYAFNGAGMITLQRGNPDAPTFMPFPFHLTSWSRELSRMTLKRTFFLPQKAALSI